MLTFDLKKYLTLFDKYFEFSKYLDGYTIDLNTLNLSAYDKSIISTEKTSYKYYIDNVIKQAAFENEATNLLLNLFENTFASLKSIIYLNQPVLDITQLSKEMTDNLLLSFNFDYLDLPDFIKKRILSILVATYKIKGSVKSVQNIVSTFSNYIVKELWLYNRNGNLTFETKTNKYTLLDHEEQLDIIYPYDKAIDEHWWIDKNIILNSDMNRMMSPFFILYKLPNTTTMIQAIAVFKYKVYKDLETYTNDPSNYDSTKFINVSTLPEPINFLELWYLIRYMYITLNYYTYIDDVGRNWFHIDYKTIALQDLLDDYDEQFFHRYTNDFGTVPTVIKRIDNDYEYRYRVITNDHDTIQFQFKSKDSTKIAYNNYIVEAFGTTNTGDKIYSVTVYSPFTDNVAYLEIPTDFWLEYPVIHPVENFIFISDGLDENGNRNENLYIIDTETGNIYRRKLRRSNYSYDLLPKYSSFLEDHKLTLVISTNNKVYRIDGIDYYPYVIAELPEDFNIEVYAHTTNSMFVIGKRAGSTTHTIYKITPDSLTPFYGYTLNDYIVATYGKGIVIVNHVPDTGKLEYIFIDEQTDSVTVQPYTNPYKIDVTLPQVQAQYVTPYVNLMITNDGITCNGIITELRTFPWKSRINSVVLEYICDTSDTAFCFKQRLMQKREDKLILGDSVLPKFNSIAELRDFLMQLTPTNVIEFEHSPQKKLIFYELLYLASALLGYDFTLLISGQVLDVIKDVIDRFKPIYSRLLDAPIIYPIVDPVGNWIAMGDNMYRWIDKNLHDFAVLNDSYKLDITKYVKDNIEILEEIIPEYIFTFSAQIFNAHTYAEEQTLTSNVNLLEYGVVMLPIVQDYVDTDLLVISV